jgi:hypothetical protein
MTYQAGSVAPLGYCASSSRPCAKHRKEVVSRDIFIPDFAPLRKHIFREPDCVSHVRFDEPPTAVVVGSLCRRDRTPHHCLTVIRGTLVSQKMCVFE